VKKERICFAKFSLSLSLLLLSSRSPLYNNNDSPFPLHSRFGSSQSPVLLTTSFKKWGKAEDNLKYNSNFSAFFLLLRLPPSFF